MDNVPLIALPSQLVETAVQELIELMRQRYNTEVDRINSAFSDAGTGRGVNVPHIPVSSYYISEVIEPLAPPAVFVIAERSEQDLSAQNVEHGVHSILMVLLQSDIEITRLVRATWRMAVAAYRAIHDKPYNNSYFYVRGVDYSPLYRRGNSGDANAVNFAKDVTVRVEAHTYESF